MRKGISSLCGVVHERILGMEKLHQLTAAANEDENNLLYHKRQFSSSLLISHHNDMGIIPNFSISS